MSLAKGKKIKVIGEKTLKGKNGSMFLLHIKRKKERHICRINM